MNVLAIAPYEELLPLMERAAQEFPNLDITVTLGNLDDAVISALTVFHRDFDAVVSRGGTAQALEDEFAIPIVPIEISAVDILASLRDAGICRGRVAAVGFSNTLKNVEAAAGFFDGVIDAYAIDFEDELDEALDEVADGGYDMILGDTITCRKSAVRGMDAVPLLSGYESVRDAFERTEMLLRTNRKTLADEQVLRDIIRAQDVKVAIFSTAGELAYSSLENESPALLEELTHRAGETSPPERFLYRHEGTLYTVHTLPTDESESGQVVFSVTSSKVPGRNRFAGITYRTASDVDELYHDCAFCIIDAGAGLTDVIHHAGANDRPIMIEGETGCGKPRVAQLIYLEGSYRSWPYVEINCDLLDDSSWSFLISDYRSPIYETQTFLYFRALHMLPEARARELLGTIQRSMAKERCKLVFSANTEGADQTRDMASRFCDALECYAIDMPPLRRIHLTGEATDRYLAHLAAKDGIEPPVLDEDARTIVESYNWPRNILQFRQVLKWAYAAAEDGTVTGACIREALDRDAAARYSSSSTPDSSSMLDLLKPLSETTAEIAQLVVESYGGNKTAAAKTLGISRTTLWNILKRADKKAGEESEPS